MIITCDQCNKKFEIDSSLIPKEGRLLKCGSCEHVWFYKFIENNKKKEVPLKEKLPKIEPEKTKEIDENINQDLKEIIKKNKNKEDVKKIEKKRISFLNILLVLIISFVALLILLETFKDPISKIFPEIDFLLNSLYEIIKDIILFFKDLIN